MFTDLAARELGERAVSRCRTIARFSESPTGITRTFLSPPMRDCHETLASWMRNAGMTVTLDAIANIRGTYPGSSDLSARRVLIGSHLDTVPDAGAFDGILGVMIGVAIVEALDRRRLPFAIEVVGFSEEEGVRFGIPFLGSRSFIGNLNEAILEAVDRSGQSVAGAIRHFGLDPGGVNQGFPDDASAYIEFHIEQGPVLEKKQLPLAVVDAIVGLSRINITFVGEAGHAGTTPMNGRHDALAGIAEWIGVVEREAAQAGGLVATVGQLHVSPGAPNVIPGKVQASLDLRHPCDQTRHEWLSRFLQAAQEIAGKRGLSCSYEEKLNQPAVAMDGKLIEAAKRAMIASGESPETLVSGAGHDAMVLAQRVPSVMVFLRSIKGISHHPDEAVHIDDVAKAIRVGVHFLEALNGQWN